MATPQKSYYQINWQLMSQLSVLREIQVSTTPLFWTSLDTTWMVNLKPDFVSNNTSAPVREIPSQTNPETTAQALGDTFVSLSMFRRGERYG
ncbi:hypothetical protein NPIL_359621 [Nephila pilipes]|uniref:Uncharacterized protein n=1 Tax=Nephila pilipes TaxID=299642 RepID=A0A8X6N7A5_NEPPI|nr:hypothetical protein NPIL_359621 [Nephila pilipes]